MAPTQDVYAVLERAPRGEPEAAPRRRLQVVRWGLVPSWAKDASIGNRMINARMETVAEKPAFRRRSPKRRALLPADGYFEWYGEVKGKKQPFFIRPSDGGVLAMAGLYELWRDPSVPEDADIDPWLWTVTVLTTYGHRRRSAASTTGCRCSSSATRYAEWLDPGLDDADRLRGLLVPAAPGGSRRTRSPTPSTTCGTTARSWSSRCPLEGDPSDVGEMADAARADGRAPAVLSWPRPLMPTPVGDARVNVRKADRTPARHARARPRRGRRHRQPPTW